MATQEGSHTLQQTDSQLFTPAAAPEEPHRVSNSATPNPLTHNKQLSGHQMGINHSTEIY